MTTPSFDVQALVRQVPSQYPFVLVDRVLEHDPQSGLVALKNVTGCEEFFVGHFPGAPVMPGVLLMESLAQAAGLWLLADCDDPSRLEVHVVGIDHAKFRRPVVPGDELRLHVKLLRRRGSLFRMRGDVRVGEQRVAEAKLLLVAHHLPLPQVDPTARVAKGAVLGEGVRIGPYCIVGERVQLGRGTVLEAHAVVEGETNIGADNRFHPFVSIGTPPQDVKYAGEPTRLEIGDANVFREFVTVNRGTAGGGGLTRIGSHNLFLAHAHVAHDCQVGSHTIFSQAATLAGHVEVGDYATIGAFSAVHQFCRVGIHAFMGGYTVATKDVLPFSKTVGNRARIYGMNGIGLARRGFDAETLAALRRAYRWLLQSRLTTSEAVARIEAETPVCEAVRTLVDFLRSSRRGVVLKRRPRAAVAERE